MSFSWRLFLDQNIRYEVKAAIETMGADVVHATDVGLQRAIDPEILRFAVQQERSLVTLDSEFGDLNLFPLPAEHPGVIRLRVKLPTPANVLDVLSPFLEQYEPEEVSNALVVITKNKVRIRRHPHL